MRTLPKAGATLGTDIRRIEKPDMPCAGCAVSRHTEGGRPALSFFPLAHGVTLQRCIPARPATAFLEEDGRFVLVDMGQRPRHHARPGAVGAQAKQSLRRDGDARALRPYCGACGVFEKEPVPVYGSHRPQVLAQRGCVPPGVRLVPRRPRLRWTRRLCVQSFSTSHDSAGLLRLPRAHPFFAGKTLTAIATGYRLCFRRSAGKSVYRRTWWRWRRITTCIC